VIVLGPYTPSRRGRSDGTVGHTVHLGRLPFKVASAFDPRLVHIHHPEYTDREGAKTKEESEWHVGVARTVDDGRGHERPDEGRGLADD
jgi:hypothetical protein